MFWRANNALRASADENKPLKKAHVVYRSYGCSAAEVQIRSEADKIERRKEDLARGLLASAR